MTLALFSFQREEIREGYQKGGKTLAGKGGIVHKAF